ncbi:MAG: glycosyltransferase family 2 protein [Clostridia bacterium]|nr:glycosyltransferase family 2 protein [Clostridia bacterium]
MKEQIYFSIVMPVYGTQQHIKKAVESVLAQTERNFELLLIDDASPDSCPLICDEYAKAHNNIKVIHHSENKGLSATRNTGISAAKGKYITFMDSDDYIDCNLLEKVKASLSENPADCVVFGVNEEYCDETGTVKKTYTLTYGTEERFTTADALRPSVIKLEEKTFYGYAWNKFYKTEVIRNNNLSFENITLIEDILFNVRFFDNIGSLNILDFAPYHYMKRIDGSLTNKFVADYYELHKRRICLILDQYKEWQLLTENVKRTLANLYARYIFSALQRNCDPRAKMDRAARKDFLRSVFADEVFEELSPYISLGGYAGFLYGNLKKRKLKSCIIFAGMIYTVKNKFPMLFAAAKQRK